MGALAEGVVEGLIRRIDRLFDRDNTALLEAIKMVQEHGIKTSLEIEDVLLQTKFRNLV